MADSRAARWLVSAGTPFLLICATLVACGSPGSERTVAPPSQASGSQAVETRGQRFLRQGPYLGVACPVPNSIACDRVGLAVRLKRPAVRVTATVNGRSLHLRPGGLGGTGPTSWEGYLQPAGLLSGRSKIRPDRGRYFWEGRHPHDTQVALAIGRADGSTDRARLTVPLRPGWG